ncbi:MAG: aminoacyl-tRNA hydrolase [Candidatus Riflemargulisbacteria bacterium]
MLRLFKESNKEETSNRLFIVGLGNPGTEYSRTRHNVGYMAVDRLIEHWQAVEKGSKKGLYQCYEVFFKGVKVYIIKPVTYMNLSGKAVQSICSMYKCQPTEFVVVYDDVSIPLGKIRIRKQGSAGGHNGIKSIIEAIGQEFPRIRIGIGDEREGKDLSGHVLSKFNKEEEQQLKLLLDRVPEMAETVLKDGIDVAMNMIN